MLGISNLMVFCIYAVICLNQLVCSCVLHLFTLISFQKLTVCPWLAHSALRELTGPPPSAPVSSQGSHRQLTVSSPSGSAPELLLAHAQIM